MRLKEENREFIKKSFRLLRSKEDLLGLLNYTKPLIFGEKFHPFTLKQITYNCNPRLNKRRYHKFTIKKKSGKEREINSPTSGLKAIQKCLNLILQTIYEVHPAANGFVPSRSIVDNASVHAGSLYVYNIDLKDFFPSIDQARIYGRLKYPPFDLNEQYGRLELANVIASLCCHEMEVERIHERKVSKANFAKLHNLNSWLLNNVNRCSGYVAKRLGIKKNKKVKQFDRTEQWDKVIRSVLPQGAPTSPTLTNIICQQLDYYLTAVANRFGLRYSRYADDITFSSMHNVYKSNSEFLKELNRIIEDQNFYINKSKTRLQKKGYRQEVTGLVVNEKPNVNKHYIKQLRMWLYYWETYGYDRANNYFLIKYRADKGYRKSGQPNMENVIAGKLDFLRMVKGANNDLYINLLKRFNELTRKTNNHIEQVLARIFENGLDDAMEFYNSKTPDGK